MLSPWPTDAVGQITALANLLAARALTADEATAHFDGARHDLVVRHLETLKLLGELLLSADGHYSTPPPLGT